MSEFERDILIARVADGGASERDWEAFRAAAERDPAMWKELAELQRDATALAAAVGRAIAIADTVEAPVGEYLGMGLTARFRTIGVWGGWAAAAGLLLMVATGWRPTNQPGLQTGGVVPVFSTPQDVLREYVDRGKRAGCVVGESPEMVMLDAFPAPDGQGFEVIYIRQIVERTMVDDLYGLGTDDAGKPGTFRVRISPAIPRPGAD